MATAKISVQARAGADDVGHAASESEPMLTTM